MSHSQPFFNYNCNNHEADDSSAVFAADTVIPDEVPSFSPASQKESPQSFTSVLLRRINSQRSPAESSTTTATATAVARRSGEISTNQFSSSSSSKKRTIKTNNSSHSSIKKTRQSSCLIRQQPRDQSCVDKSDSEVEDENELLDDDEPDEAVINQSSSSPSQTSTTKLTKHELRWKSKFEELRAYKQLHGHANVSRSNKQLGKWVCTQRQEYRKLKNNKHSCMTNERIALLESIDFEWVSQNKSYQKNEPAWNEHFNELKAYKEKYNDTDVPQNFKDNKQLGQWVHHQRTQYKMFNANKKAYITKERIQTLESIGFEWVSPNKGGGKKPRNESKWNERFNELKAYKENNGHTNVSTLDEDNKQLGRWVSHQRTAYKRFQEKKKAKITPERIDVLNSIGFEWVSQNKEGRPLLPSLVPSGFITSSIHE